MGSHLTEIHLLWSTRTNRIGLYSGEIIETASIRTKTRYQAASYSNVHLLSWGAFQEMLFDEWVAGAIRKIAVRNQVLRDYTNHLSSQFDKEIMALKPIERRDLLKLMHKHQLIADRTHPSILEYTLLYPYPKTFNFDGTDEVGVDLNVNSPSEYVDTLISMIERAIFEFDHFYGKKLRRG